MNSWKGLAGRLRLSPHGPQRRPVPELELAGHLEAEALVDWDVGFLAGFQIGGHPRGVRRGQLPADHHAAETLALLGRVRADRLQIPVRLMRVALLDNIHDPGHVACAAEAEGAEEFRAVG